MYTDQYLGFGARRKRNLDQSSNDTASTHGIRWSDERTSRHKNADTKPEERIEGMEHDPKSKNYRAMSPADVPLYLDGQRLDISSINRPKEEPHKMTVYVSREVFNVLQRLKSLGNIESYSTLVESAIKHYLLTHARS